MSELLPRKLVIKSVFPQAGIQGGKVRIEYEGLDLRDFHHLTLLFGNVPGRLSVLTPTFLTATIPSQAPPAPLALEVNGERSEPISFIVATRLASNLHPVANPAIDADGNIYTTLSGSRGQKVPVSVYKISPTGFIRAFSSKVTNPTGLAIDNHGDIYISNRSEGIIHRLTPSGESTIFAQGLGIATGLAFDPYGNLFVGDRNGKIYSISRRGEPRLFATLAPSVAAYHLAFDVRGNLYVTNPGLSGYDVIYRISPGGDIETFFTGLGRPQGLAFDARGNLYVVAYFQGDGGVVRISPDRETLQVITGKNLAGLAFDQRGGLILATNSSIFKLNLGIQGKPLP
ncbi:MAG: gluconolaconase [Candidatus Tectomicrobia bacterium]|nr:gluconolaconase [Candidatus Tectomicrobia bacterium]